MRIRSLETTTTSARSKLIRMGLEVTETAQDPMLQVSISGHGPGELAASALRSALFGEPNPFSRQYMGFATEISDPFRPLREQPVSEETLRPIAELLLVDELVGSGRAARVVTFKLGVRVQGKRKCLITWQLPPRFSSERETTKMVEGWVTL